jgi:hypothetical protein
VDKKEKVTDEFVSYIGFEIETPLTQCHTKKNSHYTVQSNTYQYRILILKIPVVLSVTKLSDIVKKNQTENPNQNCL